MLNEKKVYEAPEFDVCRVVSVENLGLKDVDDEEPATYGLRSTSGVWGPWV